MSRDKKLIELKNLVEGAEISLQQARRLLVTLVGTEEEKMLAEEARKSGEPGMTESGQVIEGVFDGQNMVGPDEKKYSVPANYASKSKLVEGDGLKLTIMPDGSFVYKQINLLERDRLIGKLILDEQTNEYRILANSKSYKVLTASITYYKGEVGDQVTILVPKGKPTSWAAVENVFKAGEQKEDLAKEKEDKQGEFLSQDAAWTKPELGAPEIKRDEEIKPLEADKPALGATEERPEDIFTKKDDDDLNQKIDNQGLEEL